MCYQICAKTVMDTSDSRITFDRNGVSDIANDFYSNVLPFWNTDHLGSIQLERLLSKIKYDGKNRDFD